MTNKTAATTDSKPAEDFIPDVADDPVEGADETSVAESAAPADEPAEQNNKPYDYRAEIRNAAVEAYRRKREEDERAAREMRGMPQLEAKDEADEPQEDVVDEAPAVEPARSAAPAAISDDAEIELVVYGVPVKKKLSELKADAQKMLAADQRLEEAKRTAEEARNLLKSAQSRRGADPDEADQPEGDDDLDTRPKSKSTKADQPDIDIPEADIDSITSRLQVGDQEEGRSAITDLIRAIAKGNTSRLDERKVADIAADVNTRAEIKKEIDTALERFNATFPMIVSDDELVDVALRRISNELRADLKAAGVSDDDLSKFANPGDLARMHGQIRRKGATKLRSYDAVLTAVGTHLQTKFGNALKPTPAGDPSKKPAPSATPSAASKMQQRVDAKRSAPQQPRAAGARTPMQPSASRPKTPSEIVAEMRKARGFSN